MDHKRPVDMKEVVARIADASDFLEFGANYGSATVCGHVTLEGWPLGSVTNNGPIDCGASFGAGNYGMCGRGFHPRFCFSWPKAKTAVMGSEQAARTMATVTEAAMKRKGGAVDEAKLDELQRQIIERFESQMSVFETSARLLDDGVIDPLDTRAVLSMVLSICREADTREPQAMRFSVARP